MMIEPDGAAYRTPSDQQRVSAERSQNHQAPKTEHRIAAQSSLIITAFFHDCARNAWNPGTRRAN
jgi:hypothetical protein